MGRYKVQFRAFSTGEWYTKTETDSKPAAFSVARIGNYGRACRLIDNETDEILFEHEEDSSMAEIKGNVY